MYLVAISIVAGGLYTVVSSIRRNIVEFANESEEEENTIDLSGSFMDEEEILRIVRG